jgi:hypothetical protein
MSPSYGKTDKCDLHICCEAFQRILEIVSQELFKDSCSLGPPHDHSWAGPLYAAIDQWFQPIPVKGSVQIHFILQFNSVNPMIPLRPTADPPQFSAPNESIPE